MPYLITNKLTYKINNVLTNKLEANYIDYIYILYVLTPSRFI